MSARSTLLGAGLAVGIAALVSRAAPVAPSPLPPLATAPSVPAAVAPVDPAAPAVGGAASGAWRGHAGSDLVMAYRTAGWRGAAAAAADTAVKVTRTTVDGAAKVESTVTVTPRTPTRPRPVPPPWLAPVVVAHVLVVVLPDPFESHLDWAFDSQLESVRRALDRDDYELDRYWLPWAAVDSSRRAGAAPNDSAPGVLLFRHRQALAAPAAESLALVYLVGETPTRGIAAAAFSAALLDRRAVLDATGSTPDTTSHTSSSGAAFDAINTLRIVGPTLSGSARSLRNAILAAQAAGVVGDVVITSGGASARSNRGELTSRTPGRTIRFRATVNPVDVLRRRVESALVDGLAIHPWEIAYLTESGTTFGESIGHPRPDRAVAGRRGAPPDASSSVPGVAGDAALDQPLRIPFPMGISRLRSEYARTVFPSDTAGAGAVSRTRLDWRDPASASESPAPLSELTAPMIERTIDDIEQTLALHRVRAVGILATDVRDRLFLADLVRTRLRDVKVVFIGSHSLYLRPELNAQLRGTLVVSTYPLFLESQFWDRTHAERDRLVFTSDLSEGTFNATLAQLGTSARMIDYALPLEGAGISAPPVWISTVGASSLLPLVVVDGDPLNDYAYVEPRRATAARRDPERAPPAARTALLLTGLLLAFAVAIGISGREWWEKRGRKERKVARILDESVDATRWPPALAATRESWLAERGTLLWHAEAWAVLRTVAIVCGFAPLTLTLFHAQVHGGAGPRVALLFVAAVIVGLAVAIVFRVRLRWELDAAPPPAVDATPVVPVVPVVPAAPAAPAVVDTLMHRLRRPFAGPPFVVRVRAPMPDERVMRRTRSRWLASQVVRHRWPQVAALAYLTLTAAFALQVALLDPQAAAPYFLRALTLTSGVTPVVPLLAGAAMVWAWCTWHLHRVELLGDLSAFEAACRAELIDASAAVPGSKMGKGRRFRAAVMQIRGGLLGVRFRGAAGAIAGSLVLCALWVLLQFDRSLETVALGAIGGGLPGTFDLLFRALVFAALGLGVWTLFRMLLVWRGLRRCLRNVEAMPITPAFARLPRAVAGLARFTPFNAPTTTAVDLVLDRAAQLRWRALRATDWWKARAHAGDDAIPALRARRLSYDLSAAVPLAELHAALCEAAAGRGEPAPGLEQEEPPNERDPKLAKPERAATWDGVAQELVALYVVDYVEWVVRHLRQLAVSLVVSLALTTVLLSCYPFEPESLVKFFFFALMAASVAAITSLLFQMNRDVTMSRITQTTPGEVTWDLRLVLNLVLVVGLPALTLLGAQFPQVREFLFSWVTPAVKAIGKG